MIRSPLTSTGLTPLGFDIPEPSNEDIGFWDPLRAAFGIDNDVTNFLRWAGEGDAPDDDDPNAWITETQFENSRYEQMYLDRFVDVRSTQQARQIMGRIDQEEQFRDVLARSGDRGFIAQLAAGVLSPTSLIPIAGWYSAIAKAGRAARTALGAGAAAVSGGVAVGLQEGFLQSVQETRPTAESVFNVIGGVVLSGVLGAGAAALSRQALDDLSRRIMSIPSTSAEEQDIFTRAVAEAQGGAAGAQVSTAGRGTGEQAGSFRVGQALSFQSPLTRSQFNELTSVRDIVRDLAESPTALAENDLGIATTIGGSVETRVKMARAPLAAALRDLDEQFQLYYFGARARFAPMRSEFNRLTGRTDKLTYSEFKERVFDAMYSGDVSDIPQVMLAAKAIRAKVIDPLAKEAAEVGMPLGQLLGDESYVPRIYNTQAIRANRTGFVGALTENLRARQQQLADEIDGLRGQKGQSARIANLTKIKDMSDDELRQLAQDVTDFILHNSPDRLITPAVLVEGPRGALQEHILEIPTKMIREFVERDAETLARMYSRSVATEVNLTKRFGSADMAEPIRKINDETNRLIDKVKAAVPSGKITDAEARIESARLDRVRRKAIRDITGIRDRLRGTYKLPDNPDGIAHRLGGVIRNLNYLRLLGGMTLSAIPDLAKPVFNYGLGRAMRTAWAPFTGKLATYKLAANEVKLAGTALDMVLDSRVMAIADVLDNYGRGSKFERGLSAASRKFGVVSLMSPWNATIKQFSGVIAQSKMLEAIGKLMAGTASRKEIRWLASAGIDRNMGQRIWNQVAGRKGTRGYDQAAYHGTPRREPFDQFSTKFMGQGEGHQSFGWGLYFADEYGLGKYYRDTYSEWETRLLTPDGNSIEITDPGVKDYIGFALETSHRPSTQGLANLARNDIEWRENSLKLAEDELAQYSDNGVVAALEKVNTDAETIASIMRTINARKAEFQTTINELTEEIRVRKAVVALLDALPDAKLDRVPTGRIYRVDIPDHDTLAWWDGTMAQQPPAVRRALESIPEFRQAWASFMPDNYQIFEGEVQPPELLHNVTFEQVYRRMEDNMSDGSTRGDELASKRIADAGVPGHRFYDGNSRNMPDESFRVFDDGNEMRAEDVLGRSAEKFLRPYIKGYPEGRTLAEVLEYLKPFVDNVDGVWHAVAFNAVRDLDGLPLNTRMQVVKNKRTFNYVIYDDSTIKIQSYEQSAPASNRLPRFNFDTDFPGRAEVDDLMDEAIANPTPENLDALAAAARDAGRDPNISPSDAAKLKDLRKAVQRKQFEMSQRYDQQAFHGSINKFGKFDDDRLGIGMHGAGHYLSDTLEGVNHYATPEGFTYVADIPDNNTLAYWDGDAAAQPPAVQAALRKAGVEIQPGETFGDMYVRLADEDPSNYDAVTARLSDAGLVGHRADAARSSAPSLQDFVIYKSADIKVQTSNNPATPQFKRWFEGSKVVDESGEPLVVYHRGGFDEGIDPVPRISENGFHFGTMQSAEERVIGKDLEDMFRSATFRQEDDGLWYWDMDGMEAIEGFPTQAEARNDAFSVAQNQAENRDWGPDQGMPMTAAYLSIKNPMRTTDQLDDWRSAIAEAKAKGHDGIVYKNDVEDAGKDSYIAFYPEQIKSVNNRGTFDANSPSVLNQDTPIGPRARITMSENRTLIELFKGRDASSFLHETGHKWLDELAADATMPGAPQQLVDDFNKALKWLKVKDINELRSMSPEGIAANEKWAQAVERYVATGKAPTKGLQKVFDNFKQWLLKIYESIKSIGINPPNDIRGVMNRLLDGVDAKDPLPPDAAVFEDVQRQLVSAGVPKDEAAANATLWAARYSTRAARRGLGETPEALYRSVGLDIRSPSASRQDIRSGGQDGAIRRTDDPSRVAVPEEGHGTRDGAVWAANTEKWNDKQAVEAFRAALVREVDRTIVTPGQEVPLWMSTGLGRIIGQFKSFGMASVQRTLVSGLQQRDMATFNGLMMMLALGAVAYTIKSQVAGTPVSNEPGKWITEALSQSGILGWLMDANNIAQRATGGQVGLSALTGEFSSRFAAGDAASTLFGPTMELMENAMRLSYAATNPSEMNEGDIRVARRLIPLQNLFYVRWLFDQVEAGLANAFGVSRNGN